MKRGSWSYAILSILLCAALLFSACGTEAAQQGSSADSPSSQGLEDSSGEAEPKHDTAIKAENIDLNNMDDVSAAFVDPLANNCLLYSWNSASEIRADHLIAICAKNNFLELPRDVEGVYLPEYVNAPADEVEKALQKNFDVRSEYLKTSKWYDADTQTYVLIIGGGGAHFRAMSAENTKEGIMIQIGLAAYDDNEEDMAARKKAMPYQPLTDEPYRGGWVIFPSGTMTVELTDENIIRYISYELNESFQWN